MVKRSRRMEQGWKKKILDQKSRFSSFYRRFGREILSQERINLVTRGGTDKLKSIYLLLRALASQSSPSKSPSPEVAQVEMMYHWRLRRELRPSFSVTSVTVMALGRSCLFAKTRTTASRNSSSRKSFCNSKAASSTRSRSFESTT